MLRCGMPNNLLGSRVFRAEASNHVPGLDCPRVSVETLDPTLNNKPLNPEPLNPKPFRLKLLGFESWHS